MSVSTTTGPWGPLHPGTPQTGGPRSGDYYDHRPSLVVRVVGPVTARRGRGGDGHRRLVGRPSTPTRPRRRDGPPVGLRRPHVGRLETTPTLMPGWTSVGGALPLDMTHGVVPRPPVSLTPGLKTLVGTKAPDTTFRVPPVLLLLGGPRTRPTPDVDPLSRLLLVGSSLLTLPG